ncbi:MAG: aminotransferase class V-fold PLP-dependent enzyme [Chloroflexi bacterium]|nr:aminotransferase class V-fold PLP-dependent enzyme [Chloroflexota bacterium]MCL5273424.1 aminotransferase class V-fold PLP-dependent enzyme [Chloroflexota bacterium]
MQPEYDLKSVREQFPIVNDSIYLNHAGISPIPAVTRRAVEEGAGVLADFHGMEKVFHDLFTDARESVARLIHAQPEEIAFVQNTAEGVNLAAHSLPLKAGDNVLSCDQEYPAVAYPFMNLHRRRGIETRIMPNDGGGTTVDLLERYVDENTRVAAVSSVEFATGFRTDLKSIGEWCKSRGIWFVVDGIQSLGAAPMDVKAMHIDVLASGGHKWMMIPAGQGFLYVDKSRLGELDPPFSGAGSVANAGDYLNYNLTPAPDMRRFELGVPNLLGIMGLNSSLRFLLSLGIENIDAWTLHLTDMLLDELDKRGYQPLVNRDPAHRSAIVIFTAPGEGANEAIEKKLKAINVKYAVRGGGIRLAPHCYNSEDEICRVAEALGKL